LNNTKPNTQDINCFGTRHSIQRFPYLLSIMASEAEATAIPTPPEGGGGEDGAAVVGRPPRPSPSKEELAVMDPAADARAILDAAKRIATEEAKDDEGQDDLEAAPLHLHTLREPALLKGTPGHYRARSRSGSRSRTSSRDVSPSPMTHASSTGGESHRRKSSGLSGLGTPAESIPGSAAPTVAATAASSVSGTASDAGSDIDPDILLDRLGFDSDLEPPAPHEVARGDLALGSTWGHSSQPMPSLNERMTEDSLEDAGAFSDLVSTLHSSLRAQAHTSQPMPCLNERMTEDNLEDAGAFSDLVSTLHTSLRAQALSEEIAALGILEEAGEEADDEGGSSEDEEEGGGSIGDANEVSEDLSQHPAVQVLDDLLAKVTDPAERAKLMRLKRDHSDKIEAAIRGIADKERRSSMEGGGGASAADATK